MPCGPSFMRGNFLRTLAAPERFYGETLDLPAEVKAPVVGAVARMAGPAKGSNAISSAIRRPRT